MLATIVADTSGHHDALCGTTHAAGNTARYGAGALHSQSPSGRELFKVAAAKHDLQPRDLPPSLSFFHGVRVEDDGTLASTGTAGAGAYVELLIHLPVVVLIANTAHPLDPNPDFATTTLEVTAWRAAGGLDSIDTTEPEYHRAVLNTEDAWAAAEPGMEN